MRIPLIDRLTGRNVRREAEASEACRQRQDLAEQARRTALSGDGLEMLEESLRSAQLNELEKRHLLVEAWKDMAHRAGNGHLPASFEHQNTLARYINRSGLTLEEVDEEGGYTDLMKSAIIWDVEKGIIPTLQGDTILPLEEGEKLVWVSGRVENRRTVTTQQPNSRGVHAHNLPVGPGGMLAQGSFPNRTALARRTTCDTGQLAFTDRRLHFTGEKESFSLPYRQFNIFPALLRNGDGWSFSQGCYDEDPQTFVTGDCRFTHALAANLEYQAWKTG